MWSIIKLIKIWCGYLKIDAGGDGKQGIKYWWPITKKLLIFGRNCQMPHSERVFEIPSTYVYILLLRAIIIYKLLDVKSTMQTFEIFFVYCAPSTLSLFSNFLGLTIKKFWVQYVSPIYGNFGPLNLPGIANFPIHFVLNVSGACSKRCNNLQYMMVPSKPGLDLERVMYSN